MRTTLLAVGVIATIPCFAFAQDPAPSAAPNAKPSQFKLDQATIDLAVPDSPAFTALGVTPDDVNRPTTPREFATSLVNGMDKDGNFQSGIAVDVSPYLLAQGKSVTLDTYRNNRMVQFLSRLQTSLATTKGTGADDKSLKAALGLRVAFFDKGDPRLDQALLNCLALAGEDALRIGGGLPPPDEENETEEQFNRRREVYEKALVEYVRIAAKPCRDDSANRRWNASSWIAGVAPTWTSPDGKSENFESSGTAFWSTVTYGFDGVPGLKDNGMLAIHFNARTNETVADRFKEGSTINQDTITLGGRLTFGSNTAHLNGEALYVSNNREDDVEDHYWRAILGFEHRLMDNTWLNISFGRELTRKPDNTYFVSGSFKWGLGATQYVPLRPVPKYGAN